MKFNLYEVPTDLIDFLRGEGKYTNSSYSKVDQQIKAHNKHNNHHTNKYLGIVIDFQDHRYFAPLTHDGDRKWFNRDECNDFERIYISNGVNRSEKYVGSLLLCKALPLTPNLVIFKNLKEIERDEGSQYMVMCRKELDYLNKDEMQKNIEKKMRECIYGINVTYPNLHINFSLAAHNVKKYNELLELETNKQQTEKGFKTIKKDDWDHQEQDEDQNKKQAKKEIEEQNFGRNR